MSVDEITILCTAIPTVIAAIAAAVVSILNHGKTISNGNAISEVHVLVNDRLDKALSEITSLKSELVIAKTSPAEGTTNAP